jgi:hypothetical protein
MTSLMLLAACALIPWFVCETLQALLTAGESAPPATRERALGHYRRATLFVVLVLLPAAAVAGALLVDPSLSTQWPTAGAWFFATLSATTAWVSLALTRRTPDEAEAMSHLETAGRAVQVAAAPILAVGLSLLAHAAVEALLPLGPIVQALTTALLCVASVIVISPWLVMKLGFWPMLPQGIEADGVSWRLAHLPAPTPFLTHTAALPWLRTALVSDGLLKRAPAQHWQTLVRYEVGGALNSRLERAARWAVAIPLSVIVFVSAGAIGADNPQKLVAAMVLAVFSTGAASWFANRQPSSRLGLGADGPSMQELAQTLRSLPPCLGQALPRTSHKPLGSALYDRLFALGHDPGPRPHR